MKLYNTLSRSLEPFAPLAPPTVTMYVCGPTVYDEPHIGHARSAYIFDVLRRYLAFKGFQVRFIRNVTDVDDKIIEKARQEAATSNQPSATSDLKTRCAEVSERYLRTYHAAMDRLGIGRPTEEPRAAQHVDEMLDSISNLVVTGAAYEAGGDVYFSVRKFPGYGKLSNRTLDELQAGARAAPGEHPGPPGVPAGAGKQDPLDFALWKAAKPDEPSWDSPWGKGRPGWHIECSTMSTKYLGDAFDIHGGGVDLVFPHHENEIAQAQAAGKPFAKYWIHNGLLTVNGEKMSKSLGNFMTVEEALKQAGTSDVLKIFFLSAHYRSPIDYTKTAIESAGGRFDGLYGFVERSRVYEGAPHQLPDSIPEIDELKSQFEQAMDDDFNTPKALAVLDVLAARGYDWMGSWQRRYEELQDQRVGDASVWGEDAEADALREKFLAAARTIRDLSKVFGLVIEIGSGETTPPSEIHELIRQREDARKKKDFQRADQIRKEIEKRGFTIEDTKAGPLPLKRR